MPRLGVGLAENRKGCESSSVRAHQTQEISAEVNARTLYTVLQKRYQANVFNVVQGLVRAVTQILFNGLEFLSWRLCGDIQSG